MTSPEPEVRFGFPTATAWTCAHSSTLLPPLCGEPATWHGINWDHNTQLFTCDDHLWKVRKLAEVVHPVDSACGLPGSVYRDDLETCVMPDADEGIEALLAAELEPAR